MVMMNTNENQLRRYMLSSCCYVVYKMTQQSWSWSKKKIVLAPQISRGPYKSKEQSHQCLSMWETAAQLFSAQLYKSYNILVI